MHCLLSEAKIRPGKHERQVAGEDQSMPPKKGKAKKAGVRKQKKEDFSYLPKQVGVFVWAQCDNAGCQKWRKLPPGTVVKDDEPWFCYMNPNKDMNDCNIPEEEYNVNTEAAIYSAPPSQAQSQDLDEEDDDASWGSQSNLRAKRPKRMSNLGRPQSGANHRLGSLDGQYAQSSMRFPDASFNLDESARRPLDGAVSPRQSGWKSAGPEYLPIAEEDDGSTWREVSQTKSKIKKAYAAFNKLLSMGGSWDAFKNSNHSSALPEFVWEGLAAYASEAARVASQAVDASNAARYFEVPGESTAAQASAEAAHLALTVASALAIQSTRQIPGVDDTVETSGKLAGGQTSRGFATGNQGGGFGILPAMQGVSAVDTCRPLQDFEALSNQWSLAQRNHDPGLLMPVSLPNGRFPLSGSLGQMNELTLLNGGSSAGLSPALLQPSLVQQNAAFPNADHTTYGSSHQLQVPNGMTLPPLKDLSAFDNLASLDNLGILPSLPMLPDLGLLKQPLSSQAMGLDHNFYQQPNMPSSKPNE